MNETMPSPFHPKAKGAIERAVHAAAATSAIIERDGKQWMVDDRGAHVPLESVKPAHMLEDEIVRKIFFYAEPLSAQVARFMAHTMDDLNSHDALLAQEYKVTRRGKKGNRTYTSYDGLMKVQVQVSDVISFGPELQQAKSLIDECLTSWTSDSQAELRVFVTRAFDVDKEGKVRAAELFRLRRFEIKDGRWLNAMRAIDDAVRPRGTKSYVRFYKRATTDDDWEPVTIDLARA
jgi:hypothetical protein